MFPGLVGSEPAGELSWQNLSGVPFTSPGGWAAALSRGAARLDAPCFLARGHLPGARGPGAGQGGALSVLAGPVGGIGNLFFLLRKEGFVFASDHAWIDRVAVWSATLLNI